jgi:hypothetical protein
LIIAGNDKLPRTASQSSQDNLTRFHNSLLKLDFKAAIYYNVANTSQMKMAAEYFPGGIR